jgi:hypothetical protein
MEAGGEGPLGLSPGALGNPPPFIVPFEPLDTGGDISCPRGFGEYGGLSSSPWYFEIPDHSLAPPIDTGDRGPGTGLRFIVELPFCCRSQALRYHAIAVDQSTKYAILLLKGVQ